MMSPHRGWEGKRARMEHLRGSTAAVSAASLMIASTILFVQATGTAAAAPCKPSCTTVEGPHGELGVSLLDPHGRRVAGHVWVTQAGRTVRIGEYSPSWQLEWIVPQGRFVVHARNVRGLCRARAVGLRIGARSVVSLACP